MSEQTLQHELGKKQPFDSESQRAFLNVLRSAADLSGPFDRLFRSMGLSQSGYNALRILRGEGPCSCHDIGQRLVVRVPDVTRLIDRLVSAGLADRTRSQEDRRVVLVSITDDGRRLLAELDRPVLELHESQLAHMSAADQRELSRLLELARSPSPEGARR